MEIEVSSAIMELVCSYLKFWLALVIRDTL
jgi:hypothetical protein